MPKDRYIYPVIITYNQYFIARFPDFPMLTAEGESEEELINELETLLAQHLHSLEKNNLTIPTPSSLKELSQSTVTTIMFIKVWMPPYRDNFDDKSVKKTLSIPSWLNSIAEEHNVNYSRLLQDSLKRQLGVSEPRFPEPIIYKDRVLKEVSLNSINPENEYYLINELKETAIKIPSEVLKTIQNKLRINEKYRDESLLAANLISVAIQLKKASPTFAGFRKLLSFTLKNEKFMHGFLTDREVSNLLDFFVVIPRGYKFNVNNRVYAHNEIGSIIEF